MGESRVVELPAGWRVHGRQDAQVVLHGVVSLRGDGAVVASCGVEGCRGPSWVHGVAREDGADAGETPENAIHATRALLGHLEAAHGLVRPNVAVLATHVYRDVTPYGREL